MAYAVVVHLSGGAASWMAGKRAAAIYGTANMVCLFADTKSEDEDTYRFLPEAAANIGAPLVTIADGRNIWQVFEDERFLGNSRVDPCSKILKRELMDKWIKANASESIQVFGFDWHEGHRLERMRNVRPDLHIEAPLMNKPLMMKSQILAALRAEGIRPPRLYDLGFDHNNCGGGCVKAGQASFALLLRTMPKRFAEWEGHEQVLRDKLGDVTIIREEVNGVKRGLSLRQLRERIEAQGTFDNEDWGACGCFQTEPPTEGQGRVQDQGGAHA